METLRSIVSVMRLQQWLASVDLKDAYFHLPVVAGHHLFLRFSWLGTSYQFGILPFGLSSAPHLHEDWLLLWRGCSSLELNCTPISMTSW